MPETKVTLEEIVNPEHFPDSFLRKKECRTLLVAVSGIGCMAMAKLASAGIRFYGVYEYGKPESYRLSCRYQLPEKHALYRDNHTEVEVARICNEKSMAATMYVIPNVVYSFDLIGEQIHPSFDVMPVKWMTYSLTDSVETVLKGLDYFHVAVPRLVRKLNTLADQCMRKYMSIDKGSMYIGMDAVIQNYLRRVRVKSPDSKSVRGRLMDKYVYAYVDNIGFTMYMIKGRPGITMTCTDMAKRLSVRECDMIRRFMDFCRMAPGIEHLNNAARDVLFDAFVGWGISVNVDERLNEHGEMNHVKFDGINGKELTLHNDERLYRWTLEDPGTGRWSRVAYGKRTGNPREFPGDKTLFLNDPTHDMIHGIVQEIMFGELHH